MDIRLVRGKPSRVWLWVGTVAGIAVVVMAVAMVFGDGRTAVRQVGAAANFGANRASVIPMETESFEALLPLDNRELGRLVHLTATAESGVRAGAVWVRLRTGHRLLVRFEPEPAAGALRAMGPGSVVNVNGYLQRISRAELEVWTDTLGVRIPRPSPGVKFGDLPDPGFAQIDSLFIKEYYVSVRPEGLRPGRSTATLRPDTADGVRPDSVARPDSASGDADA